MTMKAIPYVFKAFAIDAPHAQVRFLKDRKAMMSRGCPEVYPLKIYRHQVLNGLIKLPWAVKPMIGLTSDVLPVMGFRKASESNLHSVLVEFVSRCIGLDNVEADLKPNMNCLFWHECRDQAISAFSGFCAFAFIITSPQTSIIASWQSKLPKPSKHVDMVLKARWRRKRVLYLSLNA